MTTVSLTINGENVLADVEPRTSLADFLRNARGLTGTHIGCEHGVCGACTVTIEGSPARSCITYAVQMDGREVWTIEGYDDDEVMSALRAEFSQQHGLQCGFCTPGMLITARDIVTRLGNPGEDRVREELAGNLCRCTGYAGIVQAVKNVGSALGSKTATTPSRGKTNALRALLLSERQLTSATSAAVTRAASLRGATTIEDTVVINAPPDRVWAFFHDLSAVATCLPGAALSKHDAETWEGNVQIKVGPIRAQVAGRGRYWLVESDMTGKLEGTGGDKLSNSRVNGALSFSLSDTGQDSTKLALSLTYTLQGPLAQFSRSNLAKEFVKVIVDEFGQNVSAELSGVSRRRSGFSLGSLLWMLMSALWGKRD